MSLDAQENELLRKDINKAVITRFQEYMTEEEFKVTNEHVYQISMSKESSEKAIYQFVNSVWYAYSPIYYDLPEFQRLGIPFHFAYGDSDWLDTSFSGEHISKKLQDEGHSVSVISKSEHQLYSHNPNEIVEHLNQFLEGLT